MTTSAPVRGVDTETLAKVANLALRARLLVEGLLSGMHKSPHHGSSVEFAEHKDYSPGDEVRHIDWKRYAKCDRYTVKRFEEETNLRATLFMDASGSMGYQSGALRKWDYAVTLAASLAYLLLRQRDAVGSMLVSGTGETHIAPRSDSRHLRHLIRAFDGFEPSGRASLGRSLDALASRLRRRGLVIVISDVFDDLDELTRGLAHLRHRRHEVVLFQLLDPTEVSFPFEGLTLFESLEDDSKLLSDATLVRDSYLERLDRHNQNLARICRAHEVDSVRLNTSVPIVEALGRYLGARRP